MNQTKKFFTGFKKSMRCEFNTYNRSNIRYNYPSFQAKPIKVNWNSDIGQKLENTIRWVTSYAIAAITMYKSTKDRSEYDEELIKEMDAYENEVFDEDSEVEKTKSYLEEFYKTTGDSEILDKHAYLLRDAYINRELLKGGFSELSDYELCNTLLNDPVVVALGLFGKGTLESAFNLDLTGFENLCKDVSKFTQSISRNNLELLREKINPETSLKYRNLEEKVTKDKRKINQLLGKENLAKRKELTKQIDVLKTDKSNNKEVKELKKQIQNLYVNCENANQIKDLMQEINETQRNMKEILKGKVNLSPQEIINKVWTIAAITQSPYYTKRVVINENVLGEYQKVLETLGKQTDGDTYSVEKTSYAQMLNNLNDDEFYIILKNRKLNKDVKELIELIQEPSAENDKLWKKNIDKKIYEKAGLSYIEKYANVLNLADCKYLNELIMSDNEFWSIFPEFIYAMENNLAAGDKNIDEALDNLIHNNQTKKIYEERGIDYYKWSRYDKNSFLSDTVTVTAKDAKQKAVENMLSDLAMLYCAEQIPTEERNDIFGDLSELGVSADLDGEYLTIGIDGRQIQFEELTPIISIIKNILNTSPFWNNEADDAATEKMRDLFYNHFMLQRKQEIVCAKQLKESEVVDIKVQKVDMSDLKHSLCLGNHSHCCTALGSQANEWSAIAYIINRCISAIEVLANGEAVGNTMMYLADVNGELSLVLDDIELQTKFQNNDKIRDIIIKYAKQVCKEIGKPDIPVYTGPGMNKVDLSEFPLEENCEMVIVGRSPDESIGVYLDFDNDEHALDGTAEHCNLYRIA